MIFLLVLLLLFGFGGSSYYGYNRYDGHWGYGGGFGLGAIIAILVIWYFLAGGFPHYR